MYLVSVRSSAHPHGWRSSLIAALHGPGERARTAGQVIRDLPWDVGYKELRVQFVSEMQGLSTSS
jgi:hypothetical protein